MAGDIFKSAKNDRMNYMSGQDYGTDNFEQPADTQPQESESDVPDTEAVTTPDAAAPTPAGDAEVAPAVMPQEPTQGQPDVIKPAVMPQENNDRMIRTHDFRDSNNDGVDDRDEGMRQKQAEAQRKEAVARYKATPGLGKKITRPSEMTAGLDMPYPPEQLLANVSKYTQGLLKKSGKATPENNSGRYYGMPE